MSGLNEDAAKNPDFKDVEYNLPRNDTIHNASAAEHVGYTDLMKGKIVHAPLEIATKILDVGCGTGIVARYLGSIYPSASVYGIDISPVPPTNASDAMPSTPPNVEYIIGDIRKMAGEDERLKAGKFDCIFQRLLICGTTQWQFYISQMTNVLRAGGWLEPHEYAEIWYNAKESDRIISGSWRWQHAMRRGAAKIALDLDIGLHAGNEIQKAGFVDVKVEKYQVPFGTWMADERPETRRVGVYHDREMGPVFSESILPGVTRKLGSGGGRDEGTGGQL